MAEERCRHRLEMVMRTRCREKWMKGEETKLSWKSMTLSAVFS